MLSAGMFSLSATGPVAPTAANVSYAVPPSSCTGCPRCMCMDIYAPTNSSADGAPFVLFLHGGLWYSGARGEIAEVCSAVLELSSNTVGCATADYSYSQDLGGSCKAGVPTYSAQASQVRVALESLQARPEVDASRVLLGGHSAGGHLAAWLSLTWAATEQPQRQQPPPIAFAGVEGIYNASLWDTYQKSRWKGSFHCADWQAAPTTCPLSNTAWLLLLLPKLRYMHRYPPSISHCSLQAFGDPKQHWADGWVQGSPSAIALTAAPVAPLLLIHSPQVES
jgi:acetyl esterase/lipase